MRFFSKRNKIPIYGYRHDLSTIPSSSSFARRGSFFAERAKRQKEILNLECRNRLLAQIKFIASTQDFLEKYILVEDKGEKIFFINQKMFDDFSIAELGYKFSGSINLRTLDFKKIVLNSENNGEVSYYDDFILFDFIETIILFTQKKKRGEIIQRFNTILKEEQMEYSIKESLITKDTGDDLKNISNQLKDEKLQKKIKSYFDFFENEDFLNAAKVSADIVSIIFSDHSKKKQETIEALCKKISGKLVINDDNKPERITEMQKMLNGQLSMVTTLNNGIFDIRHSEDNRVRVSNNYVYKTVCLTSIALVELVLVTLKDDFIISDDWEAQKETYTEKYRINRDVSYYIPAPSTLDDIDPEDIPF